MTSGPHKKRMSWSPVILPPTMNSPGSGAVETISPSPSKLKSTASQNLSYTSPKTSPSTTASQGFPTSPSFASSMYISNTSDNSLGSSPSYRSKSLHSVVGTGQSRDAIPISVEEPLTNFSPPLPSQATFQSVTTNSHGHHYAMSPTKHSSFPDTSYALPSPDTHLHQSQDLSYTIPAVSPSNYAYSASNSANGGNGEQPLTITVPPPPTTFTRRQSGQSNLSSPSHRQTPSNGSIHSIPATQEYSTGQFEVLSISAPAASSPSYDNAPVLSPLMESGFESGSGIVSENVPELASPAVALDFGMLQMDITSQPVNELGLTPPTFDTQEDFATSVPQAALSPYVNGLGIVSHPHQGTYQREYVSPNKTASYSSPVKDSSSPMAPSSPLNKSRSSSPENMNRSPTPVAVVNGVPNPSVAAPSSVVPQPTPYPISIVNRTAGRKSPSMKSSGSRAPSPAPSHKSFTSVGGSASPPSAYKDIRLFQHGHIPHHYGMDASTLTHLVDHDDCDYDYDPNSHSRASPAPTLTDEMGSWLDATSRTIYHPPSSDVVAENQNFAPKVRGNSKEEGGLCEIVPVQSELFAGYTWLIPEFLSCTEEKLVSAPFGPRDWSFQLIVYPNGVGDAEGKYVSIFLRPIRNEQELVDGDNWMRQMTAFSIRLLRQPFEDPNNPQIDENGEVFPPWIVAHESEPTFTHFSKAQSGWGFPDFITLPLTHTAIDGQGSIMIHVEAYGPLTLPIARVEYECAVDPLKDISSLAGSSNDNTFISSSFGPSSCAWSIISRWIQPEKESEKEPTLAVHVRANPSKAESILQSDWSRVIDALGIQILDPISRTVHASKRLTGGYAFSAAQLEMGWDNVLTQQQISNIVSTSSQVVIRVELTMDPVQLSPLTEVGRFKSALTKSHHVTGQLTKKLALVERKLDVLKKNDMRNLENRLQESQNKVSAFQSRLERVQTKCSELEKEVLMKHAVESEVLALRNRIQEVLAELTVAREQQTQCERLKLSLAAIKSRIADTRLGMENELDEPSPLSPTTTPASPVKLPSSRDLLQAQSHIAHLEYRIAELESLYQQQLRHDLDVQLYSNVDQAHVEEVGPSSPEPADVRVSRAIDSAVEETNVGLVAWEEMMSRISIMTENTTEVEKSGIVAEISIIQSGLDVAWATLVESEAPLLEVILPMSNEEDGQWWRDSYESAKSGLIDIRVKLAEARGQVEQPLYAFNHTHDIVQSSPIVGEHEVQPPEQADVTQEMPTPVQGMLTVAVDVPNAIAKQTNQPSASATSLGDSTRQDIQGLQNRIESIMNLLHSSFNPSMPGTSAEQMMNLFESGRFSSLGAHRDLRIHTDPVEMMKVWDPEIWTPDNSGSGPALDTAQLELILKRIKEEERKQARRRTCRSFSSFIFILTFLVSIFFGIYSTVFIVCETSLANPSRLPPTYFQPYQQYCGSLIIPAWESVRTRWHDTAENLVFDILPDVLEDVHGLTQEVRGASLGTARAAYDYANQIYKRALQRGVEGNERVPQRPLLKAQQTHEEIHPKDHNVPKTADKIVPRDPAPNLNLTNSNSSAQPRGVVLEAAQTTVNPKPVSPEADALRVIETAEPFVPVIEATSSPSVAGPAVAKSSTTIENLVQESLSQTEGQVSTITAMTQMETSLVKDNTNSTETSQTLTTELPITFAALTDDSANTSPQVAHIDEKAYSPSELISTANVDSSATSSSLSSTTSTAATELSTESTVSDLLETSTAVPQTRETELPSESHLPTSTVLSSQSHRTATATVESLVDSEHLSEPDMDHIASVISSTAAPLADISASSEIVHRSPMATLTPSSTTAMPESPETSMTSSTSTDYPLGEIPPVDSVTILPILNPDGSFLTGENPEFDEETNELDESATTSTKTVSHVIESGKASSTESSVLPSASTLAQEQVQDDGDQFSESFFVVAEGDDEGNMNSIKSVEKPETETQTVHAVSGFVEKVEKQATISHVKPTQVLSSISHDTATNIEDADDVSSSSSGAPSVSTTIISNPAPHTETSAYDDISDIVLSDEPQFAAPEPVVEHTQSSDKKGITGPDQLEEEETLESIEDPIVVDQDADIVPPLPGREQVSEDL